MIKVKVKFDTVQVGIVKMTQIYIRVYRRPVVPKIKKNSNFQAKNGPLWLKFTPYQCLVGRKQDQKQFFINVKF